MFLLFATLIQEEPKSEAYEFGYQLGYFIGQNYLYIFIGFILMAAFFIYFFFNRYKKK